MLPVVVGFTLTMIVVLAVAPTARLPSPMVTVSLAKLTAPWLLVADMKETPAGSVSATVTPVALDGPLFTLVSVYASCWPAVTGSGESLLMIAKSVRAPSWVVTVEVLFPRLGSGSFPVIVAVLVRMLVVPGPM